MAWTKLELIKSAFQEIGLGDYIFNSSPEQLQAACNTLDNMMLEWDAQNIKLGYNAASTPDTNSVNDSSNLPLYANSAVISNLAIKLAPSFGKIVTNEAKVAAYNGMNMLYAKIPVPQVPTPYGLPAGAGNKYAAFPDLVYLSGSNTDPLEVDNNNLILKE